MDNKIEPSEAGKAQAIWGAAFPKCAPLASQAAGEFGHKLGWIATWFEVDESTTSEKVKKDDVAYLEEVARSSRKLAALLAEGLPAINRLLRFYHDPAIEAAPEQYMGADLPGFWEIKRALAAISKAATGAAASRRRVSPIPTAKGVSCLDRFIFALAKEYEIQTGKRQAIKLVDGKKAGPFVIFVQETARQFGVRVPAGETIAAALRKKAKPGPTGMLLSS